ncbi:olfactory receptor 1500-like [Spea bombifrons]|uniref:olfactory receptor 1500-like n=1 Tax=Spea bombifrons TaxID=233779 RepID=UPI0023492032|nr:olfactory receptor 1500-like [Spea bombifrons]
MINQSDVVIFELIGFPGLPPSYHILVSIVMFFVYMMALSVNCAVMALVIWKKTLHQPMYILIGNLALSDILFDTITLPKVIAMYWFGDSSITLVGCMFQLFFVHYLGSVDSFIIMLMALDRYVAICRPLRYPSIITNRFTAGICSFSWVFASIYAFVNAIWHAQAPYCGSRKINNCFCVNMAVSALACGDIILLKKTSFSVAMVILLLPFSFILFSYFVIILTICLSVRHENLQKTFYTCTTHLFIIAMYYGPRVFVYISFLFNVSFSVETSVLLLTLYTYLPHMANPLIYCLRTKEIKQIVGKLLRTRLRFQIECSVVRER